MSWRRPHARWWAALAAGTVLSMPPGAPAPARLRPSDAFVEALAGQDADDGGENGPKTYQRIVKNAAVRAAQYGFQNFNGDKLEVSYQLPEKEFRPYNDAFGYTSEGVAEIKEWRENAKQSAYKLAIKMSRTQSQLDAAAANIDKEYDRRLREYLAAAGFRLEKGNIVTADMPGLVKKNSSLVKPLALAFERIASQRRYRSPEIIGAVLSFAQTALHYRQPDPNYKGKRTGGLLPPLTAVLLGWGDCDTKTGLIASILSNWGQMRMVGVSVPGHYLMGVLQIPDKGDMFLEYHGLQYVLVEPAGPAWLPPGQVVDSTLSLINGREGYKLEPFF